MTRAAVFVLALLAAAPVARAAQPAAAPAPPAKTAAAPGAKPETPDQAKPPAPPRTPPPYEAQLIRLGEMTGALAYLRDLCGAGDGAIFRAKLAALIKAEGIQDDTRDLIAGAYNDAYRGYAANYRTCTPAAKEVIANFLKETERLASDVAARFGGG